MSAWFFATFSKATVIASEGLSYEKMSSENISLSHQGCRSSAAASLWTLTDKKDLICVYI